MEIDRIKTPLLELLQYCRNHQWSGYDPYDGLSSRILKNSAFLRNRIGRLLVIQANKRSPINFRNLIRIPKEQNPKALALFCSAVIKLHHLKWLQEADLCTKLVERLIELANAYPPYCAWGYNFDWQNRSTFVPQHTPNIVVTAFAGNALLDAYKANGEQTLLEYAMQAGYFLLKGLNRTGSGDEICFSYTPLDQTQVHNANLLGAVLLARLYSETQESLFRHTSVQAANFTVHRQNCDGSWFYGTHPTQEWIDHFHTGFNLVALHQIQIFIHSSEFAESLASGFRYYITHLFNESGLPKYYHNQLYPIDIHCISQSIITLVELHRLDAESLNRAATIFKWAIAHMKSKEGYFYYQKRRLFTVKIPYMRWSQAWMLVALASLAEQWNANNSRAYLV
jgi:hypothetical protein